MKADGPAIMRRSAMAVLLPVVVICVGMATWAVGTGEYFRSPVRLAGYIVIPAAIALAGLACLILGSRAHAYFVTYFVAVAAALFSFEIFLEWQGLPEPVLLGAAGEANPAGSARQDGADRAYPHLCSALVPARWDGKRIVSPIAVDGTPVQILTGLADNRLAVQMTTTGRTPRTDFLGFNNPPEQWSPGAVMVAGDSFAFGAGAPLGAGFVDRLRTLIGPVVNLGCGGNGPLSELGSLVEYGPVVRPRIVVWAYYEGNDLPKDIGRESATALLPRYLESSFTQSLYERRGAVDRAVATYLKRLSTEKRESPTSANPPAQINWRSALQFEYLRTSLGMVYGYKNAQLAEFSRVLARANDVVKSWNGRLVFAYIPGEARYGSLVARWDADAYKRDVLTSASALGLPVVDFDAEFRKLGRDPRQLFAGHFTPEGYRLAGDILAKKLEALMH
jgi:hypothetical protein